MKLFKAWETKLDNYQRFKRHIQYIHKEYISHTLQSIQSIYYIYLPIGQIFGG